MPCDDSRWKRQRIGLNHHADTGGRRKLMQSVSEAVAEVDGTRRGAVLAELPSSAGAGHREEVAFLARTQGVVAGRVHARAEARQPDCRGPEVSGDIDAVAGTSPGPRQHAPAMHAAERGDVDDA